MDGFLTASFLEEFPDNLKQSVFRGNSSFYDLFKAIKSGRLNAGTDSHAFLELLENLKTDDSELYQVFSALGAGGKLQSRQLNGEMPEAFSELKMRKSVIKALGAAYSQKADSVYHEELQEAGWKEQIMAAGGKPLLDSSDLENGTVGYLFNEKSYPLNIGETFNWARFLNGFIYPFKKIQLLDPYLYTNLKKIDLNGIIKTLAKHSGDILEIEIISDLSADQKRKPSEVLNKVQKEINALGGLKNKVKLYSQKGSASAVFHKRAICTDFWVLNAERGFDFLKLEKGRGTVNKENTLFLIGKYSSKDSLWHQIAGNWEEYLEMAEEVKP